VKDGDSPVSAGEGEDPMGDGDQRPWDEQEAMIRLADYSDRLQETLTCARDDTASVFSVCRVGLVSRLRQLLDDATGPEARRCETETPRAPAGCDPPSRMRD
jgi:hypothetical protein